MKRVLLSFVIAAFVMAVSLAQEKRYGFESAVLKKNTVMMGQTIPSIQYIADYGRKESVETFMSMQGQVFTIFTLMKDGYAYSANMTVKQGTKINMSAMNDFKTVNYLDLTDDVKKRYNIEEKGNEQLLGKDCKCYDLVFTSQGQGIKATVWVWNGLPLKSTTTVAGNTVVDEVTEIQEGKEIAKEKFELPEGINYTEIKPQQ